MCVISPYSSMVVHWSILNVSSVHLNCIILTLDMTFLSVATLMEQTPLEWLSR